MRWSIGTTWRGLLAGAALLVLAVPALPLDEASLAGLKHLFETDPAAAIERAGELLGVCEAEADLEHALAILRVVRGWTDHHGHPWATDALACRVEAMGRDRGDFAAVSEALFARALCAVRRSGGVSGPAWGDGQHFVRMLKAAQEARARAGLPPVDSPYQTTYEALLPLAAADPAAYWLDAFPISPRFLDTIRAIERAKAADQPAAACESVLRLIADLGGTLGQDAPNRAWVDYMRLSSYIGRHIELPGGDRLIPPFRELVGTHGDRNGGGMSLELAMEACTSRWAGRDDIYRETFYWCLPHFRQDRHQPPVAAGGNFCRALVAFGRAQEAEALLRRMLAISAPEVRRAELPAWGAHRLAWVGMPDSLLGEVVALVEREAWLMQQSPPRWYVASPRDHVTSVGKHLSELVRCALPQRRPTWAQRAAAMVRDLAMSSTETDAALAGLAAAAEMLEQAALPDLAAQARDLARALAASDPLTLLQCSLTSAQSQAAAGKWGEAAKALEAAVSGAPETSELLQASSLLAQAYLNIGRLAEADKWLARAVGLAASFPLPASERANHLVALADLCDLAAVVAEGGKRQ